MKHVLAAGQFSKNELQQIFALTDKMHDLSKPPTSRKKLLEHHKGRLLATLFYEASTRTRLSFESAAQRLGMGVISTENAREFSSAIKGETIEDTIRVVGSYADIVVLRHYEQGAATKAASLSPVPVINAGDGKGEHPTQAILDLYTILKETGRLNNLTVALIGDVKNSRTIHSLIELLGLYPDLTLHLAAPLQLRLPPTTKQFLNQKNIPYFEHDDLSFLDNSIDVLYVTRVQKERFASVTQYNQLKKYFEINAQILKRLAKTAIVMDPLPRVHTIKIEVDDDPRAAYFRQAENGLYVRMALITRLLDS